MRRLLWIGVALLTLVLGLGLWLRLKISPLRAHASAQEVLKLSRDNNGQSVRANLGQEIKIKLNTIGHGEYGSPQVSCSVVKFEGSAADPLLNPGGPTQDYYFRAASEGEAHIQIPHSGSNPAFAVTIRVGATAGCPPALRPKFVVDQANTAPWQKGSTNLVNDVQQTFTPSMRTLAAVEVQLVVANPGVPEDVVQLSLMRGDGHELVSVSKNVRVTNCSRVLFSVGGLEVSPGKQYRIRLSGNSTFGWKYVLGGYEGGEAWFNGRPLSGTHSTFLFRTFGDN
jgi:hypothetical protein